MNGSHMNKEKVPYLRSRNLLATGLILALGTSYLISDASAAEAPLTMGTASAYAILSSAQTTSATSSSVSGTAGTHIGVGSAAAHTGLITGYDTETVGGDALTALTAASSALADTRVGTAHGVVLGSETLTAGAYTNGTFNISGVLTLDGQGASNSVFIFRTGTTLVTDLGSSVNLINGAQACNIFWQVGSAATLGDSSTFSGHLIASATITTGSSVNVKGQLISTTGGVTLGGTTIVNDACVTPAPVVVSTPVAVPPPLQLSVISSCVDSATASATLGGTFVISGIFRSPISNISVGGSNISSSLYTQTSSTVSIVMAPHTPGVVSVQIYDGQIPLLAPCTFEYIQATSVPTPQDTVTPALPATLNIIKRVINDSGGTLNETSFVIHVTQYGGDLPGSPSSSLGATGRKYILPAGIYVLKEDKTTGYRGVWSGPISLGGSVELVAGQEITVTRTNFDVDASTFVDLVEETPTAITPTETGGVLPDTSTPWGRNLLLGSGLVLLGALGFRTRKFLAKR